MVEPVQGEGGVIIPSTGYLEGLRELCDKKGILLVLDEIQTGVGRTGKLFAYQHSNITPDIITLAKALGNGFPIGAAVAREEIADTLQPGDHAATFGGNFLACRAALATLNVILEDDMCVQVTQKGQYLIDLLNEMAPRFPFIKEVGGLGLMVRIELTVPGQEIVRQCLEAGLIINCIQGNILRFLPPFIITEDELKRAVKILEKVLLKVANQ